MHTGTPAPATTSADSVDTLIVWLRSPPVPTTSTSCSCTAGDTSTIAATREHRVEEPVELFDGLALHPQRDDEAGDLRGRRGSFEDLGHRGPRLVLGQVTVTREPAEHRPPSSKRLEARRLLPHERSPHAVRSDAVRSGRAAALADDPPSFPLGGAAPDAFLLAMRDRVLEAGLSDGAVGADVLRGRFLFFADGVEDLGIETAAGGLIAP